MKKLFTYLLLGMLMCGGTITTTNANDPSISGQHEVSLSKMESAIKAMENKIVW